MRWRGRELRRFSQVALLCFLLAQVGAGLHLAMGAHTGGHQEGCCSHQPPPPTDAEGGPPSSPFHDEDDADSCPACFLVHQSVVLTALPEALIRPLVTAAEIQPPASVGRPLTWPLYLLAPSHSPPPQLLA